MRQHSAGGLVVRGAAEILLISTRGGRRWQLPKGRLEPGESAQEAAVREIREETGVRGRAETYLGSVQFRFTEAGRCIEKRVDYYLLRYLGGSPRNFDPNEVSGADWFTWGEGIERLTFDNERALVRRAAAGCVSR